VKTPTNLGIEKSSALPNKTELETNDHQPSVLSQIQ
jgi:hypothetical protein